MDGWMGRMGEQLRSNLGGVGFDLYACPLALSPRRLTTLEQGPDPECSRPSRGFHLRARWSTGIHQRSLPGPQVSNYPRFGRPERGRSVVLASGKRSSQPTSAPTANQPTS